MPTAWTFPGQGSQSPGMGRQLLLDYPKAREILRHAEEVSGIPLNQLRERGPMSELIRPCVAEPLITAISIGYVDLMFSLGIRPDAVAGYSAGEIVSYYVGGVFDLETALKVATIRGQIFEEYKTDSHRMLAIAGIAHDAVKAVVTRHQNEGRNVYIAAKNAPSHTTIVGFENDVIRAEAELVRIGAVASIVPVGGLWHTKFLAEASQRLHLELNKRHFSKPMIPLYTSLSGQRQNDPTNLRYDLAFGVSHPVLWQPIVEQLVNSGVRKFIECGSGRVLFGLMRWNHVSFDSFHSICVEDRSGGLRPLKRFVTDHINKLQGLK